ncbi:MAG: 50S ribosomal protein L11 methyltransferase [Elusimicrobiales bacterium]|nr:50S ribosomal protein L11 methyltransferase [Elusimicrobiales bacterium]
MPSAAFHELKLRLRGLELLLRLHPEKMFVPNFVSLLAVHAMRVKPGEVFADICCGSGLHAIAAAKLGARLACGVDTNPVALRYARLNARLNGVADRCRFFQGDLLAPLAARGIKADSAVFSGPQCPEAYVDRTLSRELQAAVDGGGDGSGVNVRFIRGVRAILAPAGRFCLPAAGWCGPESSLRALKEEGFASRTLVRTYVPQEGRGNNSRYFFLAGPARRRVRLGAAKAAGGLTLILEAREPGGKPPARAPICDGLGLSAEISLEKARSRA